MSQSIEKLFSTPEAKEQVVTTIKTDPEALKTYYLQVVDEMFCSKHTLDLEDVCSLLDSLELRDRILCNFAESRIRSSFFRWWELNEDRLKNLPHKEKAIMLTVMGAALLSNGDVPESLAASERAFGYLSIDSVKAYNAGLANLLIRSTKSFIEKGDEEMVAIIFNESLQASRKGFTEDYLDIPELPEKISIVGSTVLGPKDLMKQLAFSMGDELVNNKHLLIAVALSDDDEVLDMATIDFSSNIQAAADEYNDLASKMNEEDYIAYVSTLDTIDEETIQLIREGIYNGLNGTFAKVADILMVSEDGTHVRSLMCENSGCCPPEGWSINNG
jgi:hypothetical protein